MPDDIVTEEELKGSPPLAPLPGRREEEPEPPPLPPQPEPTPEPEPEPTPELVPEFPEGLGPPPTLPLPRPKLEPEPTPKPDPLAGLREAIEREEISPIVPVERQRDETPLEFQQRRQAEAKRVAKQTGVSQTEALAMIGAPIPEYKVEIAREMREAQPEEREVIVPSEVWDRWVDWGGEDYAKARLTGIKRGTDPTATDIREGLTIVGRRPEAVRPLEYVSGIEANKVVVYGKDGSILGEFDADKLPGYIKDGLAGDIYTQKVSTKTWNNRIVLLTPNEVRQWQELSGLNRLDWEVNHGLMPDTATLAALDEFQMSQTHTRLPDGNWITNESLKEIKEKAPPEYYEALTTKGIQAYYGVFGETFVSEVAEKRALNAEIEARRNDILETLPPLVVSVEEGEEILDPISAGKAAAEGKVNADTLRELGYDVSDDDLAEWTRIATTLDQVKIKVTEYQDTPLGKVPVTTDGYNYIDAAKKGLLSTADLVFLGFTPEDSKQIVLTADLETKLEPYKKTSRSFFTGKEHDYTDIGAAVIDEAITREELSGMGYDDEDIDRAEVYSREGWKVWIPVYGTIAVWGVSTTAEKIMGVAGDVLLIVPTIGWLGKAGSMATQLSARALAVGIAPKVGVWGRLGATTKAGIYATEQLAIAPITFPLQVLKSPKVALKGFWEITKFPFAHPLETAKGIGAIATGRAFLGEPFTYRGFRYFTTAAIPEAAVAIPTRGTGVQRVFTDTFISQGIPPREAGKLALDATQKMQIRLSDMIVRGEPIPKTIEVPVYEDGTLKFTVKFDQTLVMRELGLAIHVTPFAERIMVGAAEPTPTKVYFSTAASPEWTGVTARGYTTPEYVEFGRGGAIAKDMRINRLFDPASRTYRNSVELEMSTAEGTQLVTSRKSILEVLKAEGNVRVYPSVLMRQTEADDIVNALRASAGKQFKYRPVKFEEVQSLPEGSSRAVEDYVRVNDMMVGGSTAERTWTDTIKLPEDIDLISLRNNAKLDAERLAKIFETTSDIKTRVLDGRTFKQPRDLWRIEQWNPKTSKWEQVTDVIDYTVHRTYNPDILNREPVVVDGVKVEHPLEQAERIVAKYTEYQRGEVPLEEHRGHPKRLAWMAEKLLDTPGGRLNPVQIDTLEIVGTRIGYPDLPISKIIRLKIAGLRDAVVDKIAEVIPAFRRGVSVVTPDGRTIKVPKTAYDEALSFFRNNPSATKQEIDEVLGRAVERLVDETIAKQVANGTFRAEAERLAETFLKGQSKARIDEAIDKVMAEEIYRLHKAGRFTIDDVKGMIYSGVVHAGTARAIVRLAREIGDRTAYEELAPVIGERPEIERPELERPELERPEIERPEIERPELERPELERPEIERPEIERPEIERPEIELPELERPEIERPELERPELERPELVRPELVLERLEEETRIPPPPPLPTREKEDYAEQVARIQPGTAVWMQGRPMGSGGRENVGMYKVLPPPYKQEDLFTMREIPPGYNDEGWSGKGMAQKSLQIIGGLPESPIEDIDLGWARIDINIEGGLPVIEYVHDEDANVGERSKTVGMGKGQIPIEAWEEAKAEGTAYEDFIASYRGELVDGGTPIREAVEETEEQETVSRTPIEVKYEEATEEEAVVPIESAVSPFAITKEALMGKPILGEELTNGIEPLSVRAESIRVVQGGETEVPEKPNEAQVEEIEVQESEEESPERQYAKERIESITELDESKLPQEIFGSEIVKDEELPATVVQSYIRRKKPKDMKPWWESEYYETEPTQPPVRRADAGISERTYLGHRLLPPDIGASL